MKAKVRFIKLIDCPRCGSTEFCIEETRTEESVTEAVVCRQCDKRQGFLKK